MPTEAFKAGDFSGLVDAQGRQIPIFDPADDALRTATAASSAISFPATSFPPIASVPGRATIILGYLPTPDLPGNINNFRNRSSPTWPYYDIYTPIAKVDHNLTTAQRLSVMYTAQIRHRVIWSNGMGPDAEVGRAAGQPDRQHIRSDRQQLEGPGQSRLRRSTRNLINHVTFSLDRYINRGAEQDRAARAGINTLGISGIPDDDGAFPSINYSGGTASPANLGRAYDEDWQRLRLGRQRRA